MYNKLMQDIAKQIHKLLLQKRMTIAVAESCTGGLLSSILTRYSGSSAYFLSGAVVYSNKAKRDLLHIPAKLIDSHGAVSRQVAIAMAANVRKLARADIGIGITGIAGPTGGTTAKPIGTVYIAVATSKRILCKRHNFRGSRSSIQKQAALVALGTLPKVPHLLNATH
jgi:nicotinamide-nucleotide amidase